MTLVGCLFWPICHYGTFEPSGVPWHGDGDASCSLKQAAVAGEKVVPTYSSFGGSSPLHKTAASVATVEPQ